MDEYLGIIKIFAGSFPPKGWMDCNGQILSIQQYSALFAIIGTTYGGDGVRTFGLPDLRGTIPVGFGVPVGYPQKVLGEVGSISTHGTARLRTLGVRYIICVEGLFPSRND